MIAFDPSIQHKLDLVAGWFTAWEAEEKGRHKGKKAGRAAAAQPPAEPGRSVLTDDQVVARLRAGTQGAKFAALYDAGDAGRYGGDDSRADFALIGMLRWWCRGDAGQVERLMRGSALSRTKWDDPRPGGTYLSESIKNAIEQSDGSVYEPGPRARVRVFDPESGAKGEPPAGSPEHAPPDTEPEACGGDAVDDPHRLAAAVLRSVPAGTLRFWRCQMWEWTDGAFAPRSDEAMKALVTRVCREQFVLAYQVELADWEAAGDESVKRPVVRKVTVRIVSDVLNAVRSIACLSDEIRPPCWIDGATGPDARELVSVRNGLLDADTLILHPHSPSFFTLNALPFAYDPEARADEWEKFLLSVWQDVEAGQLDSQSINAAEEWLGYCLTADLRHDKLLFLLGPPRCGKSLFREVLRQLVGEGNYAAINLDQLGGEFGLQHLPDKLVAADGDARLGGKADSIAVVKRLLTVTGRDPVYINRKGLPPVYERLTARFVICSNELPKLPDASGVIAQRFLILRFFKSFVGKEDKELEERLMRELPGILNRALEGRRRLRARGHFVPPESAADVVKILGDLTSPLSAFVRNECVLDPKAFTATADLFKAWRSWCDARNRQHPGTEEEFVKNLLAAAPSICSSRPRNGGKRVCGYRGVRFRTFEDVEPDGDEVIGHPDHPDR